MWDGKIPQLTDLQRTIILQHWGDGVAIVAIAEWRGVTPRAVQRVIQRATIRLTAVGIEPTPPGPAFRRVKARA